MTPPPLSDVPYLDVGAGVIRSTIIKSRAPAHLVRPAQAWASSAARCYKCHWFKSNQPLSGMCSIGVKSGVMSSHDTMPGDGCGVQYAPKWSIEDGLTPAPDKPQQRGDD